MHIKPKLFFLSILFSFCFFEAFSSLDSTSKFNTTIGRIVCIGNNITKEKIVLRELSFKAEQLVDSNHLQSLLDSSRQNLLNTSLFISVQLNYIMHENVADVFIIVKERWYIFPLPIFEVVDRNFNVWWRNKDYSRINYGGYLVWNNFRGRAETFTVNLKWGYTRRLGLSYSIPFISKNQKDGLGFGFAYAQNREIAYTTFDNEQVYYKNENKYVRKEYSGNITYRYRADLYKSHFVDAGFRNIEVSDTVLKLNPEFFSERKTNQRYFNFRYLFKVEHRDLVSYPMKGYYFETDIGKTGFAMLGDPVNIYSAGAVFKYYTPVSQKINFAFSIKGRLSGNADQPYFYNRALGFGRDFVRGYEYYVVDGQKYFLLKTNFKIPLLTDKSFHAGFIPLEKFATIPFAFYLNAFGDAAYVKDRYFAKYNPLANSLMTGYGIGIDFVTYYDIVIRVDYSLNKRNEKGFFLHFSAPI